MSPRHWLMLVIAAGIGLGGGWLVQQALDGGGGGGNSGGNSGGEPAVDADAPEVDSGTGAEPEEEPDVVGEEQPGFRLPALDGGEIAAEDFAGDIVVLNFWASWCPPCVDEIPMLRALGDDYADDGVTVVGIAVEDAEPARAFAREQDVDYPLAAGRRQGFAAAADYGNEAGAIPYTVFIDRAGTVRAAHFGELDRERAEEYLEPLLDE